MEVEFTMLHFLLLGPALSNPIELHLEPLHFCTPLLYLHLLLHEPRNELGISVFHRSLDVCVIVLLSISQAILFLTPRIHSGESLCVFLLF